VDDCSRNILFVLYISQTKAKNLLEVLKCDEKLVKMSGTTWTRKVLLTCRVLCSENSRRAV